MSKRKRKDRTPKAAANRPSPSADTRPAAGVRSTPDSAGSAPDLDASPAHAIKVPRWLPWAVYLLATVVLFREFIASSDMLFGGDTMGLGYMARAFYAEALKAGEFPLWNPILLGGTPFIDSLAGGDSLYPPSVILLALLEPYRALGWKLVVHVFAAGPLMALWVRSLGVSRASATVTGLAYMVAPFFVALVFPGHDGKMFVTALAPLAFWATERTLAQGGWDKVAALAGVIGLVILTTHFQMAYFLFGSMGIYAAFRTVQLGRMRGAWSLAGGRFGMFLAAAVLGAGISAVQLLPAMAYIPELSRRASTTTEARSPEQAIAYGSSYAMNPEEAMSLVVPEFVGGNVDGAEWTDGTYWGRNFFKSNHEYIGWMVLVLALLSFFGAPRKQLRLLLFGLGALALLFALGRTTPVWRMLYEVLPRVHLFRAPSQVIFITGFAWITLAGFGIDQGLRLFASKRRLPEEDERSATRAERTLWGVAGGIVILTILWATGILQAVWTGLIFTDMVDVQTAALDKARPFITKGFAIASLMTLALVGVWAAARRSWLAPAGVVVLLGGLVFIDGVRVDEAYIETFDFDSWAAPDPNIQFLTQQLSDPEPWRLLSMDGFQPGQEVGPGMHGIEMAGGHHPNDLLRYRQLIGMEGTGPPNNLLANPQLMSMLNVRYLLWPVLRQGALEGLTTVSEAILTDGRVLSAVYELPALPRARLMGNVRVLPEDQTVAAMLEPSFDPGAEVLLNEEPPIALDGSQPSGAVTWTSRGNNRSVLEVTSDRPALLVIADNWFPAWEAKVNGDPAPVLRAYHSLRAIPVGAGTSTVEMYYGTSGLRTGLWVSVLSTLLAMGVILWTRFGPKRAEVAPTDGD